MVRLLTFAATAVLGTLTQAVNLKELDPKAIESKQDGAFFVKYYSPDCKNCDEFEPKWDQLVNAHPDASFGKLNCANYVKYCKEKGVIRVPTIQSNVNGGEWHEYTGDFSLESVDKFIEENGVKRNNQGKSIDLTSSQQLKDIINSKEPWFVKFYAPWCGHCQHLAPVWNKLAKNLKNKVNVAEVNCEESRGLCQEYKVTGLPTLSYFVHGATLKYNGKRDLEKLEEYALKMAGSPVHDIESDEKLAELFKQHDVNFVYVRDPSNTIHEISFLETIAPGFMETIPFYTTTDKKTALRFNLGSADLPASVIVKDGTFYVFKQDMKDLAAWVIQESKPLVTHVLPHNSNRIMKGNQVVVLGITKPDDTDSEWKLREMAKIYKEEHAGQDLTFASLDGKQWGNFISRAYGISANKLPAIVVLDPKQELYYDRHANEQKFSFDDDPDDILASIKDLSALTGTTTAPSKTMGKIEQFFIFFGDHWMLITPVIFGFFALIFYVMIKDEPKPLTREEMKNVAKKVVQEKKKTEKKED